MFLEGRDGVGGRREDRIIPTRGISVSTDIGQTDALLKPKPSVEA